MAKLNVNGRTIDVAVEDDTPLLWVLREQIGLTGTKYGCGVAACGACTVHVDGVAVRACSTPVSAYTEAQKIVTIEGLAPEGTQHALQKAWVELDVPQCGFCQSGMLMAAAALLAQTPKPTEEQIRAEITNICRCGTYSRVLAGIKRAAESGPATSG
jgi:isoquinoline 1-oxidoreductase alpha subunit